MSRFAKLSIAGRVLLDRKRTRRVRRSSQDQPGRRAFRRLLAERLEWRILLTSVTSLNPLANSHAAPVSTDVAATFDQNINAATATPQNFVVHSMQRGQLAGSSTVVSAAAATVTSNPTSDFFPGELVQTSVTSAIQSTGGQGADAHVWQLRTAVSGGSGEFSDSGQSLGNFVSIGVSLGDVDSDGDLDAFVANRFQGNRVWINQSGAQSGTAGTFSDSGQILGDAYSRDVSLGDLDGDGDLDAFIATRNEENRVWTNQGGLQSGTIGTFSDSGQSLGDGNSRSVSLGDVDGDGDLDAFVANYGYGNLVWINQGGAQSGTAGTFNDSGQSLGIANSRGATLGDVDGDGDLDAIAANSSQSNRVWINQGGLQGGTLGAFSDSGQSLGTALSRDVSLGDVDGDGDLDAFFAVATQGNRVWINQGGLQSGTAGAFSNSGQSLGNANSVRVSLGDLDGDGDLDAFVASAGNQGNRVWINQGGRQGGTAGVFSDNGQSLGNSFTYALSLGDVDGDGDLDAFAANYNQAHRVWLNVGGNRAPTLDAIPDVTVDEDSTQQTVSLSGISAGSGETQPLKVTAESSNTVLIPNPAATYTSPNATGTLTFTPAADASGVATITVTVEDGGDDGDLSTTNDNASFSRTFDVTVNAVNDTPTLDALSNLTINQGAAQQTVNLSGVGAGGGESQPLRVTALSDNTSLIPHPSVTYVSPQATGTLSFTPVANAAGSATVTVTVEDGGLDNNLNTAADNAKVEGTFGVTVNAAATAVTGLVINGGSANRSGIASLMFQFSEATTIDAAGSLILWNHTTGAAVDVSAASLANNGTTAVTWNLSGIALPAGNYTATLPKAAAGLAATHTRSFHVLPGDSSGDRSVGFGDFGDLATNFNVGGGPIYGPGDMDGDGDVGFSDFGTLAANFNQLLPELTLDYGDAPESGTSFPTTLANDGARHVLGSGLFLGATVDAETDGQPDANAAGDGGDEDGVTFTALQTGSSPTIAVAAVVPGTAVLNGWIDFNGDGDWGDPGEQIFTDQPLIDGTNSLTAAIPAGAVPGQTFARLRATSVAGYSFAGLAKDGEVEDYQVTIVAAKSSSSRGRPAASMGLWDAALAALPSGQQTTSTAPRRQLAEPIGNSVAPVRWHSNPAVQGDTMTPLRSLAERGLLDFRKDVDLALAEMGSVVRRPTGVRAGVALWDQQLVDQLFDEEMDLLRLSRSSPASIASTRAS